jgi:hypothetical protein
MLAKYLEDPCRFAPPSVLPDISPTRGEITRFVRRPLSVSLEIRVGLYEGLISPLVGEMSGRTEGGGIGRNIKEITLRTASRSI